MVVGFSPLYRAVCNGYFAVR